MINFDVKIGFKEIVAAAVSIPLAYKKIRQLKLKYDEKQKKILKTITKADISTDNLILK